MTIKKIFKKKKVQCEDIMTKTLYNAMFDIDFINSENIYDETQLTIEGQKTLNEISYLLSDLFNEFCKENGFNPRKVISVTYLGRDMEMQ